MSKDTKVKAKVLLFFDVETTGQKENPDSRILQFAYQLSTANSGHEQIFNPGTPIEIGAMSIHHITEDMVKDKEKFKDSQMYKDLKQFIDDGVIFVAHNAAFDLEMLKREGLEPKHHICTMKLAHTIDKDGTFEKHNLQFLRYMFNIKTPEGMVAHDALSDVIVMKCLFEQELSKGMSIEEMIEISSKPILMKRWKFGKYGPGKFPPNGETFKKVAQIDLDYMMWARRTMTLDDNMLYTLNYWINKR